MSGITDTLMKQDTDFQTARTGLMALLSGRTLTLHSFMRARRSLLAVADQIAAGSAAALNEWGFQAFSKQTPLAPANDPPTGLRVRYTKDLSLEVLWKSVPGHRGYALQIGDGTPTGWGPVIQCPRTRYMPTGLTPGQHIVIRMAVQRKSGLSPFTVVHGGAQRDRALGRREQAAVSTRDAPAVARWPGRSLVQRSHP